MQSVFRVMKNNFNFLYSWREYMSGCWLMLGTLFFFLLVAALRLYRLDGPGLWIDEIFTFRLTAAGTLTEMLGDVSWEKTNPKAHYIVLWAWLKVFGVSVWNGRVLSVLAGVLGVISMYFLGRRMFNRETGLYAMALCAMCYHHLAVSQDMSPYALAFLFSVLSFLFFIAVLQELRWRHVAAYVLCSALLMHTHHFGLLVLAAQGLLFALYCISMRQELDRRIYLRAALAAGLLLLAFISLYSILTGAAALREHWTMMSGSYPRDSFSYVIVSYIHFFGSSFPLVVVVSVAIAFGVLTTFFSAAMTHRHKFMVGSLLLWIVLVAGIPYLYSNLVLPVMHYRNFTVGLPALLLLAAWGLQQAGVKYALLALLIQAASITENMVFTKQHGTFSPDSMHAAYQISYPKDRQYYKQLLQELLTYKEPVYIGDTPEKELPFFEQVSGLPEGSLAGMESLKRHLRRKIPQTFWITGNKEFDSRSRMPLHEIERSNGILDKGYQRGQAVHYKRAMAQQYLPLCVEPPDA